MFLSKIPSCLSLNHLPFDMIWLFILLVKLLNTFLCQLGFQKHAFQSLDVTTRHWYDGEIWFNMLFHVQSFTFIEDIVHPFFVYNFGWNFVFQVLFGWKIASIYMHIIVLGFNFWIKNPLTNGHVECKCIFNKDNLGLKKLVSLSTNYYE